MERTALYVLINPFHISTSVNIIIIIIINMYHCMQVKLIAASSRLYLLLKLVHYIRYYSEIQFSTPLSLTITSGRIRACAPESLHLFYDNL